MTIAVTSAGEAGHIPHIAHQSFCHFLEISNSMDDISYSFIEFDAEASKHHVHSTSRRQPARGDAPKSHHPQLQLNINHQIMNY